MPLQDPTSQRDKLIALASADFFRQWGESKAGIKVAIEWLFRQFWESRHGFTPLEMARDVLGWNNTFLIFTAFAAVRDAVNAAEPDTITLTAPGGVGQLPDGTPTIIATLTVTGPVGADVTVAGITKPIDGSGWAAFPGLPDGPYAVLAALAHWEQVAPVSLDLHKDATVPCGLSRTLYPVTVTGPAGAVVTLTPAADPALPTVPGTIPADGSGPAVLNAPAGAYTLAAACDGYADAPVAVAVAGPVTVACGLTPVATTQQ